MKRYIIIFCFIANLKVGMQINLLNSIIEDVMEQLSLKVLVALSNVEYTLVEE